MTLYYSITADCCILSLALSVQTKYAHSTNVTLQRRMNHKDHRLRTSRSTLKLSGGNPAKMIIMILYYQDNTMNYSAILEQVFWDTKTFFILLVNLFSVSKRVNRIRIPKPIFILDEEGSCYFFYFVQYSMSCQWFRSRSKYDKSIVVWPQYASEGLHVYTFLISRFQSHPFSSQPVKL